MSTTRFAPNTNFSSSSRSSRSVSGKTSSLFTSGNETLMTIRELDGSAQSMINEEHLECLNQITDTKRHLNELIEKTNGYSKNSGTSFRDNVSPKTRKKKEYRKSPYGQKLHISDYSTLCSSRRLKM